MKVLVVDDYPDCAAALGEVLQSCGFMVRTALSGKAALLAAQEFCADAIVLDLELPDISGLDVIRHLRREPWRPNIPVIVVTGWQDEEHEKAAFQAGCDGFLIKPVALTELVRLLRTPRAALTTGEPVTETEPGESTQVSRPRERWVRRLPSSQAYTAISSQISSRDC